MTSTHKLQRIFRQLGLLGGISYLFKFKVLDAGWQCFRKGSTHGRMRLKGNPHPVFFRYGSSDPSVFWQIFIEENYKPCCSGAPRVILDCGANVGYSALYFANLYPKANIICLEPDTENFKVLRMNVGHLQPRVEPLQQALWSKTMSLSLVPAEPRKRGEWGVQVRESLDGGSGEVSAISIDDLLRERGIERIDILKVDVEGAELNIFVEENCHSWLQKVNTIIIELHGREAKALFTKTAEKAGFQVTLFPNGIALAVQSQRVNA